MANIRSAKKRARQTKLRTQVNHTRLSRIRTFVRKVETAIESGDQKAAQAAFQDAQPEMMRGVNKGVYHRKTVSRKLSRLSARIKTMS